MRAIVYHETGDPSVLRLEDRAEPEPGPGEVRVRVHRSAVNPTDWKARARAVAGRPLPPEGLVPNQDGAGVIDAVGPGVEAAWVGRRVLVTEAAAHRAGGTAQEATVLPEALAVPIPDSVSFDLAASVPIPAITAHRCLTVREGGPDRLEAGALSGRTVLVAGGAGSVGHAAIELAVWAGATVLSTVSSPEKATLATAAGAHHVINYREQDAAEVIRGIAPDGVDIVVEVSARNADLDVAVLARHGSVAFYADDGTPLTVPVRSLMTPNVRFQFVLVYQLPEPAKNAAVQSISAALADGVLRVGRDAGLPLQHFRLEDTAAAHGAVQDGAIGKVLIDVV